MKLYLYEGLNKQDRASVMLWESAGRKLVEAQLTADQITQLFQQIQTAKDNRTLLGKGKDASSAVMKAYQDLKAQALNSGPVKNIDALYDQAAEKLKQATGGDQGAMAYVQKYRDFAKKHPVAQKLIYSALIAAAGISGAGAGGAAALGLFKMVDKLLQGEKFSTSAVAGAETGALAYGASKVGDYIKNRGDTTTTTTSYHQTTTGMQPANTWDIPKSVTQEFPLSQYTIKTDGADYFQIFDKAGKLVATRDTSEIFESHILTHKQVTAIFERVARLNNRMLSEGRLEEGIWDDIKSGAGKGLQGIKSLAGKAGGAVAKGAAKVGRSMTAKVSSDALTKAWKAAGSPTDSEEIEKLLQAQGVNPGVIKTVFQANNIPLSVAAGASTGSASVDSDEPMPDVMSSNRAKTPASAEPEQQATQTSAKSTASPSGVTQGVQQPGADDPNAIYKANVISTEKIGAMIPLIARLTPAQKQQLLTQIDKRLATMPATPTSTAPAATAPTQQATADKMPQPVTPAQQATAEKMPASTTPAAPAQQATADKMQPALAQQSTAAKMPVTPPTAKTAKPKVPYSAIQKTQSPIKVSAPRNQGAPTEAEYNKFQDLLKQAMSKQGA